MIYKKLKSMIASKMKKAPPYAHDIPDTSKFTRGTSIHNRGQFDPSDEPGHGMRKGQGLTRYIDSMLEAEKAGKFRFDTRRGSQK